MASRSASTRTACSQAPADFLDVKVAESLLQAIIAICSQSGRRFEVWATHLTVFKFSSMWLEEASEGTEERTWEALAKGQSELCVRMVI